jgi:hypothetical protein
MEISFLPNSIVIDRWKDGKTTADDHLTDRKLKTHWKKMDFNEKHRELVENRRVHWRQLFLVPPRFQPTSKKMRK